MYGFGHISHLSCSTTLRHGNAAIWLETVGLVSPLRNGRVRA